MLVKKTLHHSLKQPTPIQDFSFPPRSNMTLNTLKQVKFTQLTSNSLDKKRGNGPLQKNLKERALQPLTCASCGMKDMFISLQTRMYFAQCSFILLNRSSEQSVGPKSF